MSAPTTCRLQCPRALEAPFTDLHLHFSAAHKASTLPPTRHASDAAGFIFKGPGKGQALETARDGLVDCGTLLKEGFTHHLGSENKKPIIILTNNNIYI